MMPTLSRVRPPSPGRWPRNSAEPNFNCWPPKAWELSNKDYLQLVIGASFGQALRHQMYFDSISELERLTEDIASVRWEKMVSNEGMECQFRLATDDRSLYVRVLDRIMGYATRDKFSDVIALERNDLQGGVAKSAAQDDGDGADAALPGRRGSCGDACSTGPGFGVISVTFGGYTKSVLQVKYQDFLNDAMNDDYLWTTQFFPNSIDLTFVAESTSVFERMRKFVEDYDDRCIGGIVYRVCWPERRGAGKTGPVDETSETMRGASGGDDGQRRTRGSDGVVPRAGLLAGRLPGSQRQATLVGMGRKRSAKKKPKRPAGKRGAMRNGTNACLTRGNGPREAAGDIASEAGAKVRKQRGASGSERSTKGKRLRRMPDEPDTEYGRKMERIVSPETVQKRLLAQNKIDVNTHFKWVFSPVKGGKTMSDIHYERSMAGHGEYMPIGGQKFFNGYFVMGKEDFYYTEVSEEGEETGRRLALLPGSWPTWDMFDSWYNSLEVPVDMTEMMMEGGANGGACREGGATRCGDGGQDVDKEGRGGRGSTARILFPTRE